MALKTAEAKLSGILNIDSVTQLILSLQSRSGDIPWHTGGKTDPWDLVETTMGLNIAGRFSESILALDWLKEKQNSDGSWYSSYINGVPEDKTRETHMAAYIAVGLFHLWLIRKESGVLKRFWPVMEKAVNFAISLQTPGGEIFWAKSPQGKTDPMALLTGSSSIYMSLRAAIMVAQILGHRKPLWEIAFQKLGHSINDRQHHYNVSKSRFSMYWFYPVLSGALTGSMAAARIEKYWSKYVIEGQGARCVSDQPWVTIAETSELVLALNGLGQTEKAKIVFSWIQDKVYDDKTFWCGYTYPDMVIWPEDKISWTNAVVVMAADALYGLTPAASIFNHASWDGFVYKDLIN